MGEHSLQGERPVLSGEERRQRYLEYRLRYLPDQIEATERKLAALRNEARRYGLYELAEGRTQC